MSGRVLISEIFGPTIQGEGPLIGRPSVFVRTAGCDYRCRWCDTDFAVSPEHRGGWVLMTADDIMARVVELSAGNPVIVTLSGGNPALQPLEPVIALGRSRGYRFALETQGSVAAPWFADLDWLIVSPKPPSSAMVTDWSVLDACCSGAAERTSRAFKIVVFDDADYDFARSVSARYPALPVYLQVGNPAPLTAPGKRMAEAADLDDLLARLRWLAGKVMADCWFAATVLPQLHVLAWGNKRGV